MIETIDVVAIFRNLSSGGPAFQEHVPKSLRVRAIARCSNANAYDGNGL